MAGPTITTEQIPAHPRLWRVLADGKAIGFAAEMAGGQYEAWRPAQGGLNRIVTRVQPTLDDAAEWLDLKMWMAGVGVVRVAG